MDECRQTQEGGLAHARQRCPAKQPGQGPSTGQARGQNADLKTPKRSDRTLQGITLASVQLWDN